MLKSLYCNAYESKSGRLNSWVWCKIVLYIFCDIQLLLSVWFGEAWRKKLDQPYFGWQFIFSNVWNCVCVSCCSNQLKINNFDRQKVVPIHSNYLVRLTFPCPTIPLVWFIIQCQSWCMYNDWNVTMKQKFQRGTI